MRITVVIAVMCVLGIAYRAAACSCDSVPDLPTLASRSDAVFAGKVLSRRPDTTALRVALPSGRIVSSIEFEYTSFRVLRAWKGVRNGSIVEVSTALGGSACGYNFVNDGRYTVFASKRPTGDLVTGACGLNAPYDRSREYSRTQTTALDSLKHRGAFRTVHRP